MNQSSSRGYMPTLKAGWMTYSALSVAMIATLLADIVTPLGFAHGLLYTPLIVLAILTRSRLHILIFGAMAVFFTVLGLLISHPALEGTSERLIIFNRVFSILQIAVVTIFGLFVLEFFQQREEASSSLARTLDELEGKKRLLDIAEKVGRLGGWSILLEDKQVKISDEVARIHGLPVGTTMDLEEAYSFYSEADQARLREIFDYCVKDGIPYDEEFEFHPKGGGRIWVRSVGQPVRDRSGVIVGAEGAFQDITARKEMEASADFVQKRVWSLADAMPIMVWTADASGTINFFNKAFFDYTGLTKDPEALASEWLSIVYTEDRKSFEQSFSEAIDKGIGFTTEVRLLTANGESRWHVCRAYPIRDAGGNLNGWYGSAVEIHEQKQLAVDFKSVSERLERTLESITDAILTVDHEWRFTFLNRKAEELLEQKREVVLGQNIWQVFKEAVGSRFYREYHAAIAEGKSRAFEEYYPPLGKWFSISAYPSNEGLAIYFRDITELRKDQETLRLLETSMTRLSDIVLITEAEPIDEPGPRIVYVNDAFERITGWKKEEVIGKSPRILQGPKTRRGPLDRIRKALSDWQPVREEVINYTKDGREFWLEIEIVPIADENGWYTHWVAVERDITERKKAEEELGRYQQRLRLILESVGEGIHGMDKEGRITFQNPAALSMLGWAEEEILGKHSHPLIHHHKADGSAYAVEECPIYTTIKDGEFRKVSGEVFFRKDGSSFPVDYTCSAVRDASGEIVGAVVSFRDVSDRQTLEEQLRQSQRLEAVGQLTGGLAHDFNNLLTVIQGNSELLIDMLDDREDLLPLAKMVSAAAVRGSELTHRLLAFARKQALDPRAVDVNRLVLELESLLRRVLGEQIEIELVRGAGLWNALVDRAQLESALLNLALNARDAMPNGGRLTIETSNFFINRDYADQHHEVHPGQYVMVAVSDTGSGIKPEVLARVFEPFFTTKSAGKGSGLGLSMVYGFVKQSRGHIKVYSEVDQGTTIRIYLPRVYITNTPSDTPLTSSGINVGNEIILLVEDDDLVRQYAESALRGLGYTVLVAEDGPRALEILKVRNDINLLFTDIVMPGGMNGRQLADAAKALHPNLKVLYTSGYTDNAIVHHGRLDPGAQLLNKPYGRADLSRKIREVLESS